MAEKNVDELFGEVWVGWRGGAVAQPDKTSACGFGRVRSGHMASFCSAGEPLNMRPVALERNVRERGERTTSESAPLTSARSKAVRAPSRTMPQPAAAHAPVFAGERGASRASSLHSAPARQNFGQKISATSSCVTFL